MIIPLNWRNFYVAEPEPTGSGDTLLTLSESVWETEIN